MKISLLFAICAAFIVAGNADVVQNFIPNHQSSIFESHNNSEMNSITAISIGNSRSSSDYQENTITLSAVNLNRPHILSINTTGSQLQGKIIFNGKVIKQIRGQRAYINLSPYLSLGEHTVKISARYSPVSSSVNVELNGPGIDVNQQTSGNGVLNYTLNVSVN
ncbi:MAG: hypothetical protein RMY34_25315 [Aulosira sp. DedQUE10]|nr:hypothetical protein [Aulosira sp. DedQUE10]